MNRLLYILLLLLSAWLGFWWGSKHAPEPPVPEPKLLVVRDVIRETILEVKDSIIVRWKIKKVPVVDSVGQQTPDSANVVLPVVQKQYEDSDYTAWVSGIDPNLDSIHITRKTYTYFQPVPVPAEDKRWGIGVQVGVGVMGGKIEPYVGLGVSYNLWNF